MRDRLKDKQYFIEYINEEKKRIEKFEAKLMNNEVKNERILPVRRKIHSLKFQILIARYSMGEKLEQLIDDYKGLVNDMVELWHPDWYDDMLWMLSIGVMLEIDDQSFNILIDLVEKNKKEDWLYYFMINYRNKNYTYSEYTLMFDEPYKEIYEVVKLENNKISLLREYLQNRWYSGHSDAGWYDSHKSKENLYYGYWSFESGAIVKILGLDDSELKDVQYYPYDLVHYSDR